MIFLNHLPSYSQVIVGDIFYILSGSYDAVYSKAVYAAPLDALSSHQLNWQQLADIPWLASAACC